MKSVKRQISFLERSEIEQMIEIIPDDGRGRRDRALLEVLFSTGLRISEALALSWGDVWKTIEKAHTAELVIVGKGGWQRVVYISPPAIKAIKNYIRQRIELTDNDVRLFPITPRGCQKMIKERARLAGIEKRVTPHVMRHSFATDLLSQGVDIRIVSEFLGHRSLMNTLIYTHVVSKTLRDIHERLYK